MDTKKYLISLTSMDVDTNELIHHLTMNGYPFEYDQDKRVLEIDEDHLYETMTILNDRGIAYDITETQMGVLKNNPKKILPFL